MKHLAWYYLGVKHEVRLQPMMVMVGGEWVRNVRDPNAGRIVKTMCNKDVSVEEIADNLLEVDCARCKKVRVG